MLVPALVQIFQRGKFLLTYVETHYRLSCTALHAPTRYIDDAGFHVSSNGEVISRVTLRNQSLRHVEPVIDAAELKDFDG